MENSMSRLLIEATVRQTLKNLREDPKRSTRNLIDMALQFSQGRFQNRFFETAHTMLKNENSAYYPLIQDATRHIETEHLVRFGMNVGYNSCTWGAHRIRSNEQALGFNIPWTVFLKLDDSFQTEAYRKVIAEGEHLGIYCWMLFPRHMDLRALFPLIKEFSNSAFFLFFPSGTVTEDLARDLVPLYNLMPVVRFDRAAKPACALLRDARLPYSLYYPYSQKDAARLTSGEMFGTAQKLHPIFTALIPGPDCSEQTRRLVYQAIIQARNEQRFETVAWELYRDTCCLDEIISDDACWIEFDSRGDLLSHDERPQRQCGNLFRQGLTSVIRQACPKTSRHPLYRPS